MADPAFDASDLQGRILPKDADVMVMACLVTIGTGVIDDPDRRLALYLLERALPMASRSSRMAVFRPLAQEVLRCAPARRQAGGAYAWMCASLALCQALSRDAAVRARALVADTAPGAARGGA